jgi:hypothetical protein
MLLYDDRRVRHERIFPWPMPMPHYASEKLARASTSARLHLRRPALDTAAIWSQDLLSAGSEEFEESKIKLPQSPIYCTQSRPRFRVQHHETHTHLPRFSSLHVQEHATRHASPHFTATASRTVTISRYLACSHRRITLMLVAAARHAIHVERRR